MVGGWWASPVWSKHQVSPSYPDTSEPIERRPYSDWFGENIGNNHIHPIFEKGRFLQYFFVADGNAYTAAILARSYRTLVLINEMNFTFKAEWSSARFYSEKNGSSLIFYFADQSDAAMFKLIWESI